MTEAEKEYLTKVEERVLNYLYLQDTAALAHEIYNEIDSICWEVDKAIGTEHEFWKRIRVLKRKISDLSARISLGAEYDYEQIVNDFKGTWESNDGYPDETISEWYGKYN